ncbi:MAG: PqqD family protein [Acidobacteria bacterium]|nr:PqqD family protein [Acidobacteriota bacterium]
MFDDGTCFRISPEATGKIIDGEAVIIDLATGVYYSLNPSGSRLWELLSAGQSREAMAELLSAEFGIGRDRAEKDLDALLIRLIEEGLVAPDDEAPAAPSQVAPGPAVEHDYAPPELLVYHDMADLLALDPPVPGLMPEAWDYPEEPDPPEDTST